MFFTVVGCIITILEATGCVLFFDVFQPQRRQFDGRLRRVLTLVALSVLFVLISFAFESSFLLRQTVAIICIAGTMIFIMGYGYLQAFCLSFFFQGFLLALEFIGMCILEMMVDNPETMTGIEVFGSMNVSFLILTLMLLSIILVRRLFRKHHNEALFRKEWVKFIIFPLFTNVVLIMTTTAFDGSMKLNQAYALISIDLGLVIMNFFLFYLLDDTIKTHRIIKNDALYLVQKKDRMEMYTALYNSFERLRNECHDFKNHVMCLKSLADRDDFGNIKEYIRKISDSDIMSENVVDSHHPIINAVINIKYYEAASKQIALIMKINDLSNIRVENDDLVILLSNLLNNAIEATEKCEDKRNIYLMIKCDEEGLVLSVKNPYAHALKKTGDDYISSKESDSDEHGIGLKNVRKVIEKYKGTIDIHDGESIFATYILIPNN